MHSDLGEFNFLRKRLLAAVGMPPERSRGGGKELIERVIRLYEEIAVRSECKDDYFLDEKARDHYWICKYLTLWIHMNANIKPGNPAFFDWMKISIEIMSYMAGKTDRLKPETRRNLRRGVYHIVQQLSDFPSHINEGSRNKKSIVYFIKNSALPYVKIGTTRHVSTQRLPSLQTGSPVPLHTLYWFYGSFEEEKTLHKKFHDQRIVRNGKNTEWFKYSLDGGGAFGLVGVYILTMKMHCALYGHGRDHLDILDSEEHPPELLRP